MAQLIELSIDSTGECSRAAHGLSRSCYSNPLLKLQFKLAQRLKCDQESDEDFLMRFVEAVLAENQGQSKEYRLR